MDMLAYFLGRLAGGGNAGSGGTGGDDTGSGTGGDGTILKVLYSSLSDEDNLVLRGVNE